MWDGESIWDEQYGVKQFDGGGVVMGLACGLHGGGKVRRRRGGGTAGKRRMEGGRIRLDGIVGRFAAVWMVGWRKVAGKAKAAGMRFLAHAPHLLPIYSPSYPHHINQTLPRNFYANGRKRNTIEGSVHIVYV